VNPHLNFMAKKRKLSGLSGVDLVLTIEAIEKLQRSLIYEESETEEGETGDLGGGLADVLSLLKARVGGTKPLSFSGITNDDLEKLNITPDDKGIFLKSDHAQRAATTSVLGQDKLWSSLNFYRQLELLETLVPTTNEACARVWIDAFFFRASAMLPSDKHMVLSLEQVVPQITVRPSSSTTLSGFIDYTAVTANEKLAKIFLSDPILAKFRTTLPTSFFVAEAKVRSLQLTGHLPQAISEIYACAKSLKKNILRGALTDGHAWIFIILVLNSDGNGAKYRSSLPIYVGHPQVIKPWPDVVAAILSHWIENSFADIASDDWFESSSIV